MLYTGAPVVDGRDLLADALVPLIRSSGLAANYDELDVDVFGSELASEVYSEVKIERLAVVALTVGRPRKISRAPQAEHNRNESAWCWP